MSLPKRPGAHERERRVRGKREAGPSAGLCRPAPRCRGCLRIRALQSIRNILRAGGRPPGWVTWGCPPAVAARRGAGQDGCMAACHPHGKPSKPPQTRHAASKCPRFLPVLCWSGQARLPPTTTTAPTAACRPTLACRPRLPCRRRRSKGIRLLRAQLPDLPDLPAVPVLHL